MMEVYFLAAGTAWADELELLLEKLELLDTLEKLLFLGGYTGFVFWDSKGSLDGLALEGTSCLISRKAVYTLSV